MAKNLMVHLDSVNQDYLVKEYVGLKGERKDEEEGILGFHQIS